MSNYICKRCHFTSSLREILISHLENVIECETIYDNVSVDDLLKELGSQKLYKCGFGKDPCPCEYTNKTNLYRHKKKHGHLDKYGDITSTKQVVESASVQVAPINSTVGNVTVNNSASITVNITLENLGDENHSHLNLEYIMDCMRAKELGVRDLVKEIHFSDKRPQNNNIRMKNINNHQVDIVKDQKWITVDDDEAITKIVMSVYKLYYGIYFINNEYGICTNDKEDVIKNFIDGMLGEKIRKKIKKHIIALVITNSNT